MRKRINAENKGMTRKSKREAQRRRRRGGGGGGGGVETEVSCLRRRLAGEDWSEGKKSLSCV